MVGGVSGVTGLNAPSHVAGAFRVGADTVTVQVQRGREITVRVLEPRLSPATRTTVQVIFIHSLNCRCALVVPNFDLSLYTWWHSTFLSQSLHVLRSQAQRSAAVVRHVLDPAMIWQWVGLSKHVNISLWIITEINTPVMSCLCLSALRVAVRARLLLHGGKGPVRQWDSVCRERRLSLSGPQHWTMARTRRERRIPGRMQQLVSSVLYTDAGQNIYRKMPKQKK